MEMIFIVFGFMAVLACFYFGIRGTKADMIADAKFFENRERNLRAARAAKKVLHDPNGSKTAKLRRGSALTQK